MSRQKTSYCISDGISFIELKELVLIFIFEFNESDDCMTLMYDEKNTNQKVKQMDVLVRY